MSFFKHSFLILLAALILTLLSGCVVPGYPYAGPPSCVPQPLIPPAAYYSTPPVVIAPIFYQGYGYGYWYRGNFCPYHRGYYFHNGCYHRGNYDYNHHGNWNYNGWR